MNMSKKEMSKGKLNYGNGFDESNSIAIVWSIAEVKMVIEMFDMEIDLKDSECVEVLKIAQVNLDMSLGMSPTEIFEAIVEYMKKYCFIKDPIHVGDLIDKFNESRLETLQ
tara:strand:- start:3997 stop:4329 length:333 start_codon:yes stop_codon:yes gene_type:complete